MVKCVFIGPTLRIDPSKPILYRAQSKELGEELSLFEASSLTAATLEDPRGQIKEAEMRSILFGLYKWDGLPMRNEGAAYFVKRSDISGVIDKLRERIGALPEGLSVWCGLPAEAHTILLPTDRIKALLADVCPTIDSVMHKGKSTFKWLEGCCRPDQTSPRLLLWDYWRLVGVLRDQARLMENPPDPNSFENPTTSTSNVQQLPFYGSGRKKKA